MDTNRITSPGLRETDLSMTTHEIDPTGDVILTLRTESAIQAIKSTGQRPSKPSAAPISIPSSPPSDQERQSENDSASIPTIAAPASVLCSSSPGLQTSVVKFRLSSKHLSLVSEYFLCMLSGPWREASPDENANYALIANEWDEEALLIVMKIVHGQTWDVPRSMNLELLTKIALVVDYYQFHQVIEPWYTNIWPRITNFDVSQGYNKDFASRLFIHWVFSDADEFADLTKKIIRESREPLRAWNLALPMDIIGKCKGFATFQPMLVDLLLK